MDGLTVSHAIINIESMGGSRCQCCNCWFEFYLSAVQVGNFDEKGCVHILVDCRFWRIFIDYSQQTWKGKKNLNSNILQEGKRVIKWETNAHDWERKSARVILDNNGQSKSKNSMASNKCWKTSFMHWKQSLVKNEWKLTE